MQLGTENLLEMQVVLTITQNVKTNQMKKEPYKVLGHEVNYNVPETSTEFNALPHDPKVTDPCLEEAKANIVYRSMNPDTRFLFLHGRSQTEVDEAAKATPPKTLALIVGVEEQVESLTAEITDVASLGMKYASDGEVASSFSRRTKVRKSKDGSVKKNEAGEELTAFDEPEEQYYNRVIAGLVAAKKFASEDAVREHFQPLIESIAAEVPFDIMAGPREARGPKKLAAKYKLAAAKVILAGTLDSLNANQLTSINKSYTLTGDTAKMFEGTIPADGKRFTADTPFKVSDKDAEALGWLIKEWSDWRAQQAMEAID